MTLPQLVESSESDILIEDHFSLFLVWPLSAKAENWIQENVSQDRQWFGTALVVEPRYVGALIEGMIAGGLILMRRAAR